MLNIIQNFFKLCAQFISQIYVWEIEWTPGNTIQLGTLVVGFVAFILILYYLLSSLGIIGRNDD